MLLLLLLSWACVGLGRSMWSFIPICLMAALVLGVVWKNKTIAALVLLNPMAIAFYQGAAEWFDERPAFTGNGLPNCEASNLDRETRCYRRVGGCVVYGGEWVYHDAHNSGLRLMLFLLGPPPKTYHGPYPSQEEAINATAKAALVSPEEFEAGKFKAEELNVEWGEKMTLDLLSDLGLLIATEDGVQIRTAIWQKECLIIHVQKPGIKDEPYTEVNGIYLFQIKSMKPIARYLIGETRGPRIPRLLWQ